MTAQPWSGLAPAVDAHLHRWSITDRHIALADLVWERRDVPSLNNFIGTEWGRAWMRFAATYGVPGPDGKPMTQMVVSEGETVSGREQRSSEDMAIWQGARLAQREHEMLARAVSHYVSGDVMDEVTTAALLAEPEPIHETDLFTPYGIAIFETPIVVPDLDFDTGVVSDHLVVHIRAMGWAIEPGGVSIATDDGSLPTEPQPGLSLWVYTTHQDYLEGFYESMTYEEAEKYAPEIGDELHHVYDDDHLMLIPCDVIPWQFGREWGVRNVAHHISGMVPLPISYQRRWFLAFMRLCWQEIIVHHQSHVGRAQHRRWDRMAKRKELLDYTTLRLRRLVDPNYEFAVGTGVPLDHQVLVRGHWRRQHYRHLGKARLEDGSMNPESHRLIWIEPYWKGPEDGPIGAMDHATSVTR